MRILILGASGMLGNAMMRLLSAEQRLEVAGTYRNRHAEGALARSSRARLFPGVDVLDDVALSRLFETFRPEVVVNCVGLVKQLAEGNAVLSAVPVNTLLPHRLAALCDVHHSRLVHFSTDCVFSGGRGMYLESDSADARDVYGLTKFLGEISAPPHITLRTSMIGHELASSRSLVDWFLSQHGRVSGFRKAIFSGLPTVELARIMRDFVLPRPDLTGLFHVSAEPIDKLTLLRLIAKQYDKEIVIEPSDAVQIDRSLNSDRFREMSGYTPPDWPALVAGMHDFG